MIYRITGGIAFILLGATALHIVSVSGVVTALFCVVAGIALLAGV
jgi:hypothetical protein